MNRILAVAILLVSAFAYILAPNIYSFEYCFGVQILFALSAIVVSIMDSRNEKVGFNLLFSLSFFFTNFVYPVYIYPIDPCYSLFRFPFNDNVITKCTALAQVAYSAYLCGYLWHWDRIEKRNRNINASLSLDPRNINHITIMVLIYFCCFVIFGGLEYFEDRYQRGNMSTNMLVQYIMLFFPTIIISYSSLIFLCRSSKQVKQIYFVLLLIAIILLSSGTRTFPLLIFSTLFIIYCFRHNPSAIFILSCAIVGVLLMSFIGEVRNGELIGTTYVVESSDFGVLDYFSDLFINNRNLYVFYDFVEQESCTYGLTMVSGILSPIPFAQKLFIEMTGIPYYFLGSADLSTFLEFGNQPPLGLGTNIVGDVYLAFGLIGVFILFFLLGRFVLYARKMMKKGSYMYTLVYLVIASDAIYMCRATYLDPLKIVIWTLLLALFVKYIYRNRNQCTLRN